MIRRFAAFSVFMAAVARIAALEWPLEDVTPSALFGQAENGRFSTGIELTGDGKSVRSSADGTVVFIFDKADGYGSVPSGLGNFIAIEHDEKIVTVYGHLKSGSTAALTEVKGGQIIGQTGSSGYSEVPGLIFEVYDRSAGQYVNPLSFLSVIVDKKVPSIKRIYLDRGKGPEPVDTIGAVKPGKAELLADIADQWGNSSPLRSLAPYSIEAYFNGSKRFSIISQVIKEQEGTLYLMSDSPLSVSQVFGNGGKYRLGTYELRSGRTVFEILCKDFSGNKEAVAITVAVGN